MVNMIKFFDIHNQDKNIHSKILKDLKKLFKKTDFILGNASEVFEGKFANYCNTKFAIGCANGTDALYLALKSLKLPKNAEVILPAMTYCSTAFSVIRAGLKPILVDIEESSPNMSIEKIKSKISSRTKVILIVHLYGESFKYSLLKKIIKNKKIFIVEDASQAHGAYDYSSGKKGEKVGAQGDIACFSLYPGKNLGAYGDAGIITTNNKKLNDYIKTFRNLGSNKKFHHDIIGVNSRLDTIQSLILIHKLKNLDKYNKKRTIIAKRYKSLIKNKLIKKLNYSEGCVYHQYVITTKNINRLLKYLKKNKIPYGRHYPYPIHKLKALKNFFKNQKFPNSEYLARNSVSLPIDPLLKKKDLIYIINKLNLFK